jgi:putative endopeptidase
MAVLAFETRLAQAHWDLQDRRDAVKTYNRWAMSELDEKAGGFDWRPYLARLGFAQQATLVVNEPSALVGEAQAWDATDLPVLRDWLTLRVLRAYAPYLSTAYVEADFQFYGEVLSGTPQNRPRWKRGVALVSGLMGDDVGRTYVARYFPPQSKAAADELVSNLIAAYRRRLALTPWMAPETRLKAVAKLDGFKPMIGYPDRWRDYRRLRIVSTDLVGNIARAEAFEHRRNLGKLGQRVDRGEWLFPPMATNGWANQKMNTIVFPAALLQAPLFDANADPAVNYGGIGVVIGHEISHHFDDQGRKYDAAGRLNAWWTNADVVQFKAVTDKLVAQYDAYEPLPGLHANGARTLSENLADLAGLSVSLDAYQASITTGAAPVLSGFSGEQRFFLAYAQISREKVREAAMRQHIIADEHAPGTLRVNEFRNLDAWYRAFDVMPGRLLYLRPEDRVRVW